jgi:hypothetical protein
VRRRRREDKHGDARLRLQDALNCRQCLLGSWKEHQAKTTDSGIKSSQRLTEILCCAFEGFDVGETSARGRFP